IDDPNIASVQLSPNANELVITALAQGVANITLNVTDTGGEPASAAFTLEVSAHNNPPTIEPLPPLTLNVGESTIVTFNAFDPDGDILVVNFISDNQAVATTTALSATEVSVNGVSVGTATITATVSDPSGASASTAFTVTVNAVNQIPNIEPIAPITFTVGDTQIIPVVSSDPDGDVISITPQSDNTAIVEALMISDNELQLTATGVGVATITLIADDGRGGQNSTSFLVTVNAPPAETPIFDINTIDEYPEFGSLNSDLGQIYSAGVNNSGLNPVAFSIVGNLPLPADLFDAIEQGNYNLGDYPDLQNAIQHFDFAYQSQAINDNWTLGDILTVGHGGAECDPTETPLDCELRLRRPVVVFISIAPSNATLVSPETFAQQLNDVITVVLQNNSVPVLLTLADDGTVDSATLSVYNQAIVEAANAPINYPNLNIPVWNVARTVSQTTQGANTTSPLGIADFSNDSLSYGNNAKGFGLLRILEAFRQAFMTG
ncbi:MAG: hypothetical protein CUN55_08820, partial [Phototrophicales bacterium]